MKTFTLIFSFFCIATTHAASIETSNGVELLAIDGKEITSSFFGKQQTTVENGTHQLVVRYSNRFSDDYLVESKPVIFSLLIDSDSQISVPNFNTKVQADNAVKNGLTWQIISNGETQEITNVEQLAGEGFMPYADIEKVVAKYNKNMLTATAAGTAVVQMDNKIATTNIEQLIGLYNAATKEDKKTFRIWLLEQDMK